jgi:hypothetical protein
MTETGQRSGILKLMVDPNVMLTKQEDALYEMPDPVKIQVHRGIYRMGPTNKRDQIVKMCRMEHWRHRRTSSQTQEWKKKKRRGNQTKRSRFKVPYLETWKETNSTVPKRLSLSRFQAP